MTKFLLVYADSLGTREQIKSVLNGMPEVAHWRFDMPNCFYIYSNSTARELLDIIRAKRGGKGRCMIVKMDQYYGWLPNATWVFFKKYD